MSFQGAWNSAVDSATQIAAGNKIINNQNESLVLDKSLLESQQRAERIKAASLGLKNYTDTMKDYNNYMNEYDAAKKERDDAFVKYDKLRKEKDMAGENYQAVHDQKFDEIVVKGRAEDSLANYRKFEDEMNKYKAQMTGYYQDEYDKAYKAYADTNKRFNTIKGQKQAMDDRKFLVTQDYNMISKQLHQDIYDSYVGSSSDLVTNGKYGYAAALERAKRNKEGKK